MSSPTPQNERTLEHIDRVLAEIRESLPLLKEQGDVYELMALQLLLHVTKAMHSEHNIHKLVALILDSALSFAQADRAFLMMIGDDQRPRFKMGRSYQGEYLAENQFSISMSVVQEVLTTLQPVIVADAQTDGEFSDRQSVASLKLRTIMSAPLVAGDQTLGLIYVDSQRPLARYSKHHINVLNALASQASVALANARKFETFSGEALSPDGEETE